LIIFLIVVVITYKIKSLNFLNLTQLCWLPFSIIVLFYATVTIVLIDGANEPITWLHLLKDVSLLQCFYTLFHTLLSKLFQTNVTSPRHPVSKYFTLPNIFPQKFLSLHIKMKPTNKVIH